MKVIIKHKSEYGRGTKYRAGSIQDLPDDVAQELIEQKKAIPYQGPGSAIKRETRVEKPDEIRATVVNNKRALQVAKDKRKAERLKAEAEAKKKAEAKKVKVSADGTSKDNGTSRKSNQ